MGVSTSVPAAPWLNYLHLQRFWRIARERSMTRAARALHVSQSTLSEQLRDLEESLGHALFERRGRELHLTEAGRVALEHAETIFHAGEALTEALRRERAARHRVRLGAVGPLSKNLQYDFLQPLLGRKDVTVSVTAGGRDDLLRQLRARELDLVLANVLPGAAREEDLYHHLLGEMPVYLAGCMGLARRRRAEFPAWLEGVPLFLPSRQTHVREDFDALLAEAGVKPDVRAEVDDMALLRLLALSGRGLALVPAIVVKHELRSRRLRDVERVPGISERFYAVTLRRRFGSSWLEEMVREFRRGLREFAS